MFKINWAHVYAGFPAGEPEGAPPSLPADQQARQDKRARATATRKEKRVKEREAIIKRVEAHVAASGSDVLEGMGRARGAGGRGRTAPDTVKRRKKPLRRGGFQASQSVEHLRGAMRDADPGSTDPSAAAGGARSGSAGSDGGGKRERLESMESRTSAGAGGGGSKGGGGGGSTAPSLPAIKQLGNFAQKAQTLKSVHSQTRFYAQRTHTLKRGLKTVDARLEQLKKDIVQYRTDIGGKYV